MAAWHEAGHAVVTLQLGYEIGAVWASPDGKGAVEVPGYAWMEPEDAGRIALAGVVAEQMYEHQQKFHVGIVERLLRHAEIDLDAAFLEQALKDIGGDMSIGWQVLDETANLLRDHWNAVSVLAWKLVRVGRLERDEVLELLNMDPGPLKAPAPPKAFARAKHAGSEPATFPNER